MQTRTYVRTDGDYECRVTLSYDDFDHDTDLTTPVSGEVVLELSSNAPHPVEFEIRDIEEADAEYAHFDTRSRTVESTDEYPVRFRFLTSSAHSGGGKWFSYSTADYYDNSLGETKSNPEFVQHHLGIPSAQKIRLTARILDGHRDIEVLEGLTDVYGGSPTDAAREFSNDLKKYVGFGDRAEIQAFLVRETGFDRSQEQAVNKVAKQVAKDEYQHRVASVSDVEAMVDKINTLSEFPDITIEEVVREVDRRCTDEEMAAIADRLDVDEWAAVASS